MFVPYNTDAPLYYRPIGTISLIIVNCLVFLLVEAQPAWLDRLALPHGTGLTPGNWVTSNFAHAGVIHLAGNMIFLWSFGLIVEGKLGWARFIPLFLAIGVTESLLEQVLFWNGHGASCGASAVIFGLMAICLIWAPQNELSVFYTFFLRSGIFEISILLFSLLLLAKSLLYFQFLPGAQHEFLHLLGAGVGALAGLVLLKSGKVDCEGWDLFSMMKGPIETGEGHYSTQYQADRERRKNRRVATRKKPQSQSHEIAIQTQLSSHSATRFSELVEQNKPQAALNLLAKIRLKRPNFQPAESDLLTLARSLRTRREWNSCVEIYQNLLQVSPNHMAGRLELAEILTLVKNRPSAARRLIENLPEDQLTEQESSRLRLLRSEIQEMIESGVLEIQDP